MCSSHATAESRSTSPWSTHKHKDQCGGLLGRRSCSPGDSSCVRIDSCRPAHLITSIEVGDSASERAIVFEEILPGDHRLPTQLCNSQCKCSCSQSTISQVVEYQDTDDSKMPTDEEVPLTSTHVLGRQLRHCAQTAPGDAPAARLRSFDECRRDWRRSEDGVTFFGFDRSPRVQQHCLSTGA